MGRLTLLWRSPLLAIPVGAFLVYAVWLGFQAFNVKPDERTFYDYLVDPETGLYSVWLLYLWAAGLAFVAPLWSLIKLVRWWVLFSVVIIFIPFYMVLYLSDVAIFQIHSFYPADSNDARSSDVRERAHWIALAVFALSIPAWLQLGVVSVYRWVPGRAWVARALATLFLPTTWIIINLWFWRDPGLMMFLLTDLAWVKAQVTYALLLVSATAQYGIWHITRNAESRLGGEEFGLSVAFYIAGLLVLFFLTVGLVLGE